MIRRIGFIVLAALLSSWRGTVGEGAKLTVHYLVVPQSMSHEDSASVAWLESSPKWSAKVVSVEGLGELGPRAIVWVHIPDAKMYDEFVTKERSVSELKRFYDSGGNLLFTDYGAMLPWAMGIEAKKPEVRIDTIKDDWLWDKKGFQGFRGHPLFASMNGGEYVWDPYEDQVLPAVGYFDESFPENGRVIAVDKAYVFVHQDRKLVFEYSHNQGTIVSVGSAIYLGRANNARQNLEQFLTNVILYLAGANVSGPRTYWRRTENVPQQFSIRSKPIRLVDSQRMQRLPSTSLLLTRQKGGKDFFDVAGRRALIMGKESGGIDELWVHPFQVLRDFEIGLVTPDSVTWLRSYPASIEVRPESFTRIYTIPAGRIKEVVYASLTRAGGNVYAEASVPVRLVVRFRSDLRWMWPYDANALGNVDYAYDGGLQAVHIRDESDDFHCVFGADCTPFAHALGQFESLEWKDTSFAGKPTNLNQVYSAFLYELNQSNQNSITFAMVGTNEGARVALEDYRELLEYPRSEYSQMVEHYSRLLRSTVTVQSQDKEFDNLFQWAIVGTDRFLARTPGIGEGLLAGFGTTARGWNGAQKISGRPGYAWYFGRDSEWSGFAIDDYGDVETVRKQLTLLQQYQDRTGKIFHEISTSGVVHYDAADATPLFPILAAHYLRASGDTAFLRQSWPKLQMAMKFLYSTDTDGDGLIENTNVGHGWVEGGALFGAHTEFYLAGLWSQALSDMAYVAEHLGEKTMASKYRTDATKVRAILNTDFWNNETQFYNEGKYEDGSYNREPTALVAVPMYYGLLDEKKVQPVLDAFAGNGFSSDWGVRIVSSSSRLFDPQGYHYGSIWPLFTGWVSLGEYEYGNSTQAFVHVMNNLYLKKHWALGFVTEVMHGIVYKPGGVCFHQCWSETNVLHPAINGMVGWKPDAPSHSAILAPRFPVHWGSVSVRHLRVGTSSVSVTMIRGMNRTTYDLALEYGPAVTISLCPEIPKGMQVTGATVNGALIDVSGETRRGLLAKPVTMKLEKVSRVVLEHRGGAAMFPIIPNPVPNDSSEGYRVVSESVKKTDYEAVLEGKSGSAFICRVKIFDQVVKSVSGGELVGSPENGVQNIRISFDSSALPFTRRNLRLVLGKP
jgi:glycogen debranching enzyme